MKKIMITLAAAALVVPAMAQMTPESVMGMTPDLPSSARLVQYYRENNAPYASGDATESELINDFLHAWREASDRVQEMQKKTLAVSERSAAMQGLVGGTGKTAQEVSRMSEAEVKALAMSTMQGRIGSMGLSQSDMARLMQSEKLSEDEEKALASKVMAAQTGGLTAKDIEAMSNMTEEQRMEFMQNSGLGKSVSAKMAADKGRNAAEKNKAALVTRLQDLSAQAKAKTDKIIAMKGNARNEGLKLYDRKYRKRVADAIAGMKDAIADGALEEKPTDPARSQAAAERFVAFNKARFAAICDFYEEYIPAYRNAVAASMDCCRAELLPILREKQQVQENIYAQTKDASWALSESIPFDAAYLYMECAHDIVDFELNLPDSEL